MFKAKLKHLLIGLGIGVGVFVNSSAVFADTTIDKLELIFNQLKSNPEFQNGQLYLNAKFVTQSGLVLEWDSATGKFVIGQNDNTPISNPIPQQPTQTPTSNISPPTQSPISNNNDGFIITTFNNLKAIQIDNNIYFSVSDYVNKSKCNISWDKSNMYLAGVAIPKNKDNIIIYRGITYINSKYYK
jgi:hypothetical protein